jgi:hypothetical protein
MFGPAKQSSHKQFRNLLLVNSDGDIIGATQIHKTYSRQMYPMWKVDGRCRQWLHHIVYIFEVWPPWPWKVKTQDFYRCTNSQNFCSFTTSTYGVMGKNVFSHIAPWWKKMELDRNSKGVVHISQWVPNTWESFNLIHWKEDWPKMITVIDVRCRFRRDGQTHNYMYAAQFAQDDYCYRCQM